MAKKTLKGYISKDDNIKTCPLWVFRPYRPYQNQILTPTDSASDEIEDEQA